MSYLSPQLVEQYGKSLRENRMSAQIESLNNSDIGEYVGIDYRWLLHFLWIRLPSLSLLPMHGTSPKVSKVLLPL